MSWWTWGEAGVPDFGDRIAVPGGGPAGAATQPTTNVTLDTSSIQFYVSQTRMSSREEIEVAPTQQVIPVDEPVDRLTEPEKRPGRIEVGKALGKLAPRRSSAVLSGSYHCHNFQDGRAELWDRIGGWATGVAGSQLSAASS